MKTYPRTRAPRHPATSAQPPIGRHPHRARGAATSWGAGGWAGEGSGKPAPLSPGPRLWRSVWGPAGVSLPPRPLRVAGGKWQGPEEQCHLRGTPPPQSPVQPSPEPHSAYLRTRRSPKTPTRPASQPGTPSAPRPCVHPAGSSRPSGPSALRVRQRRRRRETVCAAPPAAPPSSSVENSGAGRADARPAARQAACRPAPEAPPPPPPRAGSRCHRPPRRL